ncbi:MAG: hydroxymethylbilane synthase [Zoogloeaceae bacterium]|jgi:hydroxymethylbilane synthase|nr:hydroxymethylbilane synthase [Zoogloeaceae bacterium]
MPTIASRQSRLALWQAEHVRAILLARFPQTPIDILGMTTRGDQILDRPLSAIGGKGLFIKELEVALAEGRADLAVHSMKDVPMEMPEGFALAAIMARETPFDAFVSNDFAALDDLPAGAKVGTSSLRRAAVLRRRYPQLVIESLRGNLDTRLKKLDDGQYAAIVLAAAGLIRLGLSARIRATLPPELFLPAPGQGALGIEIRTNDPATAALVAPLNDPATSACVRAERAFSRALGGSCQVPLGAYATLAGERLTLCGFICEPDGSQHFEGTIAGTIAEAEALGQALAGEAARRKGAA